MAGPIDPRLVRRGRATRAFLVALAAVGIASTIAIIAQAKVLATAISTVFASHRLDGLDGWVAALAGIFVVRAALAWLNAWLAQRAAAAVKSGLRADLLRARLARPLDVRTSSSTLTQLVTQGLDALDGYYSKYLPQLVLAVVVPVMVLAVIAREDVLSAVIIAVTLPLIPVFMALIGWTTEAQVAKRWKVQNRLANHFSDLVTGLATLQVFGRARAQLTGLAKTEDANRRETNRTLRVSFLSSFALELLSTLSVALVAVGVGFRVVYHHMELPEALFVLILAPEAYLPIRQVGTHYHDAADGMAAADQALQIIEGAAAPTMADIGETVPGAPLLELEHIRLTHDGATEAVLDDFSLAVGEGELVALTGPSGGGKSTALAVAMGFLVPSSGRVMGRGREVTDFDAWRRELAWVGQNPGMVRGTVADNLLLGCESASTDAMRHALDAAGAESIELDHLVGDDAEGLSAGERRRVAIARALLRIELGRARLLVMDEPTAGLDADTEARVLRAVRASGASALVVTHRPAVLAVADRVLVLGDSAITPVVTPSAPAPTPAPESLTIAAPARGAAHAADAIMSEGAPGEAKRDLQLVRKLLDQVPGGRTRLVWTLLLAAAASGASVALMAVSAWLLSRAAEHPPVLYLEAAAVGVRFFGITRGVARYAERLVGHDLALRMQGALRLDSYDALSRRTLLGRRRGDLLTRLVADVDAIQDVLVRVIVPFASAGIVTVAACLMIAWFDPATAAAVLATALVASILLPWLAQRASRAADRQLAPARGELAVRTDELAHTAADVVANGKTEQRLARVLEIDRQLQTAENQAAWARGTSQAGQMLAMGAAVVAGLWFGSQAVVHGTALQRVLGLLVLTPLALHEVFATFGQASQTWTRARSSLARVCAVLDAPRVGLGDQPAREPSDQPSLRLADATVGWPGHPPVLEGVDLTVHPGERVALVGRSGIGKTTLLATVMGLIPPQAGRVEVQGQVGYLAQDAHLFATSIAENVRIGNREATDEQVAGALAAAGLEIEPGRVVGEQGATLSGGEARRIALARVLVGQSQPGRSRQVLLLDEPTEHLDRETADRLLDDLWRSSEGCAVLVVTHDERLVARCDRVVRIA